MGIEDIERLLRDNQATILRERRSSERKPFTRPLKIIINHDQETVHEAFSRDISSQGIGVISRHEFRPSTMATIQIHALTGEHIAIRSLLRWCEPYGEGWFASGWVFVRSS